MYPTKPGLLIGFHGCEEAIRNDIVSGKSMLTASNNKHDWLGPGFYFWESNYERAFEYACHPPGKRNFKSPAVLGAIIDLQHCLDLLNTADLRLVKRAYNILSSSAANLCQELPVNRRVNHSKDLLLRELDCAVMETLHLDIIKRRVKPFDSIRGVFVEGEELYPGAGFKDKNHIQICIRNPNCIKGFFIPRHEVHYPGDKRVLMAS